ncbi:TPA: RidA family protein [Candidatus Galligastranaerophilus faecipullorum]|nr:RidA family protein [Candidatus Galligastranaerophilus faecipullorum]
MKKIIYTKNAPDAIGPYSQAYLCNGMLFSSGQIAIDPKTNEFIGGDIKEQTERIMKNLEAVLKEAGFSFEDVIKTTCFLKDMNDFAAFNEIYGKYFTSKPARSCVAAAQLPKGALAEVEIIASK